MTVFKWKDSAGERTQQGVVGVSYLLILGMVVCSLILVGSLPDGSSASGVGVGLTVFLLFSASAAIGAAVGFLFGLPRSRFADAAQSDQGTHTSAVANGDVPRSAHYLTNSNLIKVSDWLTTIIIGLGLVNLAKIGPAVGDLGNTLEDPLGGAPYSGTIGVSVIVIALLASLILCYLWTSIRVRELLEDSEEQSRKTVVPQLVGVTVGEAKTIMGATALRLVVDDGVDDALIVGQEPPPGSTAAGGSDVKCKVGPPG